MSGQYFTPRKSYVFSKEHVNPSDKYGHSFVAEAMRKAQRRLRDRIDMEIETVLAGRPLADIDLERCESCGGWFDARCGHECSGDDQGGEAGGARRLPQLR